MAGFGEGEQRWIERLGNLRNTVRQELIRRQLAGHAIPGMTVLDVGCGQGTQAIELAKLGCVVTGVDPSPDLLDRCRRSADERGVELELLDGSVANLDEVLGGRRFDLVCAHGLLMYLPDRAAALVALRSRVRAGGLLSVTCRNGHALAFRPAMRRDWAAALAAFDTDRYVNELGVAARADRLEDVESDLGAAGLDVVVWYGVRIFNDAVPSEMDVPTDEDLDALLDAEDQAGRLDPYRRLASQLHVVARRP